MCLSSFRIIIWLLLVLPLPSLAAHQVGGQVEMQAVGDTPGHYRVIVTNYFEAGPRADAQTGGGLGIFRKRDNAQVSAFYADKIGENEPIVFSNAFCARLRNLNFITVLFEAEIQLDPANYNDPQGYYISYQSRNRNGGINNIRNSAETGFTYYLEFPALQQNGNVIRYSSPHFPPINGEYICIGEPFTFPFGATDPDDDQLRYSLVTPLNQKDYTKSISAGPYPSVTWLPGFGANNAIPGKPALSINAQTGQLSVTATQAGLFVFGVNVEKYRNGKKIGEVRRDFQFLVVDCLKTTLPSPAVQVRNQPAGATEASICEGGSTVLETPTDTSLNYQWRRNGFNLPDANTPSLTVYEAGTYTVVVSPKASCINPGISKNVIIKIATATSRITVSSFLCLVGGSAHLQVVGNSGGTYRWYRNDQLLPGQTTDSVRVTQEGQYWAILTSTLGCVFTTDTVSITRSPATPTTIRSATGQHRLCPQGSLVLETNGGIHYTWQRDGQLIVGATGARYGAKVPGSYVATATNADGCQRTSTPFVVESIPPITVIFAPIPTTCGSDTTLISLRGSPPGGEFAGSGVVDNEFNPRLAGVGNHTLTYTVKAAPECAGTVAIQTAVVAPLPTIQLPDTLITSKGSTLQLTPSLSDDTVSFQWLPATYLDNSAIANPSVVAIADDITYTLISKDNAGCVASDTVHITVFDRIWVPDAFTPNGDGINDVLKLPGIEAFPDAVVTIFNRWGEVVYLSKDGYAKPFDGTFNGALLPTGIYPYTLRHDPDKPLIQGRLVLLRD